MFSVKKRIIRNPIILACVLLAVISGCNRGARHKVLTFFFEGVPPLDADRQAADTKTPVEELPTVADEKSTRITRQTDPSEHDPGGDCNQCHLEGSWDKNRLAKSLPDLCYSCHTNYSNAGGFLHGPIAAGECAFCHEPHQSKYIHLQKAPQPDLCYRCHLQEDIGSIADHRDEEHQICTECHDPHMGSTRNLLKSQLESSDASDSADLSE